MNDLTELNAKGAALADFTETKGLLNSSEKSRSGKTLNRNSNNRVEVLTSPKKTVPMGQISLGDLTFPNQNTRSPANQNRDRSLTTLQPVSRQIFPPDSNQKSLPVFGTGQSTNVKVVIRVRPVNEREKTTGMAKSCIQVENESKITLDRGADTKNFTFDYVASQETSQEQIFQKIAQPIADSCLQGYNGTIFAYGQTGSGKTYTIQGPTFTSESGHEQIISAHNSSGSLFESRGLMQRSFEHIFACIEREKQEAEANGSEIKFLIKSSYLEIYNEQVMDLLDPSQANLHVREDIKTGVYVEGLLEEPISSVKDMISLICRGSRNRHVGSTTMNKESSRSHSVLTTIIESKTMTASGVWQMKSSCFHIIDLAGSERSKHTNAEGQRLKEAGMINKSLSALGIVINSLVDISEGKTRHVHYRDSKLTFLLRDSLGGNSKTVIIANITQAQVSMSETLSTLQFAQRAKLIKNKAVINEESSGTIQILKGEIRRLKQEIAEMSQQMSQPVIDDTICKLCQAVNQSESAETKFPDEMLIERKPIPSGDTAQMAARIVKLENLLAANLDNLTSNHKYFETELEKKNQTQKRFQSALDQLDKQSQRDKMIIKFRDQRIQKLEETVTAKYPQEGCTNCQLQADVIEKLTKERDLLQQLYDKQTSTLAAKLFAEKEELKSLNETYLKELHQTPESLTAQVRNYSELTDNLSQYIRDHCNEPQKIQDLAAQKDECLLQISQLQVTLEELQVKSAAQVMKLQAAHKVELDGLESLLRQQHKNHASEISQLQRDSQNQIAQIKQDLKTLSESEASYAQSQIDFIEKQNDYKETIASLQHQLTESEQSQLKTNTECTQLLDKVDKLNAQLAKEQNEHTNRLSLLKTQFGQEKELASAKLKLQCEESEKEISELQKALMAEQARTDALQEGEDDLKGQVARLETLSESLSSQLIQEQESLRDARQELSECKSQTGLMTSQIQKLTADFETSLQHFKSEQCCLQEANSHLKGQISGLIEAHALSLSEATQQCGRIESEKREQIKRLALEHQRVVDTERQAHSETTKQLRNEVSQLTSQLACAEQAKEKLQIELTKVQESLGHVSEDLIGKNAHLSSQVLTQQTQISSLKDQLTNTDFKCNELAAQLTQQTLQAESEVAKLESEFSALRHEYIQQAQSSDKMLVGLQSQNNVLSQQLQHQVGLTQDARQDAETRLTQLAKECENKIASKSQQLTSLEVQLQQTVNQCKSIELERMGMEVQLLKVRQESDAVRQQYQTRLEQIEATVRRTLEVEKAATKEELHSYYQQEMQSQQASLGNRLLSEYNASLSALEATNMEKLQSQSQDHRAKLEQAQIKYKKDLHQVSTMLRQDYAQKLATIAPKVSQLSRQLNQLRQSVHQPGDFCSQLQRVVSKLTLLQANEVSRIHTGYTVELTQAKSQVNDLNSQLTDYKGLTKQLQHEKQTQINSSRMLADQLQQAEQQLRTCLEIQENDLNALRQQHQVELSDQRATIEAFQDEIDHLRGQYQECSAELAKSKQRSAELAQQLRNSKQTISGLVEKETALMEDLEGRMGEIGISQDKWKQKCADQKREILDLKSKFDSLSQKYEIVCSSRDQLISSHETKIHLNEEEVTQLQVQLRKRETEIKEIVRTLKKYSDDKKALEAELAKRMDTSEGHQNLQQKIQHHLKIKEENNKLRQENFQLLEEVRRRIERPDEQSRRDCMLMVESLESICEKALQLPGSAQFLHQVPQMNEVLRKASLVATSTQQAALNCKQKAAVVNELLANQARVLTSAIQAGAGEQQKQLVTPSYKVTQPSQGQITQPRIGSAQARSSSDLRSHYSHVDVKQVSLRPPLPSNNQKPFEKENKVNQAASFLNTIQQRNSSNRKQ